MNLSIRRLDFAAPHSGYAGPSHQQLIAALAASQTATPTARATIAMARSARAEQSADVALLTLFCGAPGWAAAIGALAGSFDPALAGRLVAHGL